MASITSYTAPLVCNSGNPPELEDLPTNLEKIVVYTFEHNQTKKITYFSDNQSNIFENSLEITILFKNYANKLHTVPFEQLNLTKFYVYIHDSTKYIKFDQIKFRENCFSEQKHSASEKKILTITTDHILSRNSRIMISQEERNKMKVELDKLFNAEQSNFSNESSVLPPISSDELDLEVFDFPPLQNNSRDASKVPENKENKTQSHASKNIEIVPAKNPIQFKGIQYHYTPADVQKWSDTMKRKRINDRMGIELSDGCTNCNHPNPIKTLQSIGNEISVCESCMGKFKRYLTRQDDIIQRGATLKYERTTYNNRSLQSVPQNQEEYSLTYQNNFTQFPPINSFAQNQGEFYSAFQGSSTGINQPFQPLPNQGGVSRVPQPANYSTPIPPKIFQDQNGNFFYAYPFNGNPAWTNSNFSSQ